MARLTKTLRDQTLAATRQCLLDAAAAEFASEGYVGANINRISSTAGFAKGTIYNYFSSKQALMAALIDDIAAAHVETIITHVERETDPVQRLDQFFRAGFAFVDQNPDRARVVINLIYGPDEAFRRHVYQAYQPLFDLLIHDIVGAGIDQGTFRPADSGVTAALVMTVYLGSCSQRDADGKIWFDPSQVMSFILNGLRCSEDGSGKHEHDHLIAQG
jgi:AcrR family transcriptional regulator